MTSCSSNVGKIQERINSLGFVEKFLSGLNSVVRWECSILDMQDFSVATVKLEVRHFQSGLTAVLLFIPISTS